MTSLHEPEDGEWPKRLRDDGYSAMIRKWDHWITIEPSPDGRTNYRDEVEISAGVLTPFTVRLPSFVSDIGKGDGGGSHAHFMHAASLSKKWQHSNRAGRTAISPPLGARAKEPTSFRSHIWGRISLATELCLVLRSRSAMGAK